jgi:hypothetical protein
LPEQNVVPRRDLTLQGMSEVARRAGWHLEDAPTERDTHEDVLEFRWRVDDVSTVTLVKNVALKSSYLVVSAPDPGDVIASISSLVPSLTATEIVNRLQNALSDEERVNALSLVAASGLRHYWADLYEALVSNLRHPSPRVRGAALVAAFHLNWNQLRPIVQQTRETDEDSDVRTLAKTCLALRDWSAG